MVYHNPFRKSQTRKENLADYGFNDIVKSTPSKIPQSQPLGGGTAPSTAAAGICAGGIESHSPPTAPTLKHKQDREETNMCQKRYN